MAKLVFADQGRTHEFVLDSAPEVVTIGRNPRCEIRINNASISRQHAEIRRDAGGGYTVTDNQSSNGTFVNGQRVPSARVRHGDVIVCGEFQFAFVDEAVSAATVLAAAVVGPLAPPAIPAGAVRSGPAPSERSLSAFAEVDELKLALETANRERDSFQDQVRALMFEVNRLRAEVSSPSRAVNEGDPPQEQSRRLFAEQLTALRIQLEQVTNERDTLLLRSRNHLEVQDENRRLREQLSELERRMRDAAPPVVDELMQRIEAMKGAFAEMDVEMMDLVDANRALSVENERLRSSPR